MLKGELHRIVVGLILPCSHFPSSLSNHTIPQVPASPICNQSAIPSASSRPLPPPTTSPPPSPPAANPSSSFKAVDATYILPSTVDQHRLSLLPPPPPSKSLLQLVDLTIGSDFSFFLQVLAGGPFYPAHTDLQQGVFTDKETFTLLGAHSTGMIHCKFFEKRLYNFGGTNKPDLSMDSEFLELLRSLCNN
ncbi:unnamed protein product [Lactuca virosa]|uniref:peroxidase n=1 Tax=Lactuca virosa TaxID=75947 RepID=A0AAU9MTC8_9ASTR|nr:unnamed protein product [Lactuca virosa]